MDIAAISTAMLVLVGVVQLVVVAAQRRQSQLNLVEEYRKRWLLNRKVWGTLVFIGRDEGEYYQVLDSKEVLSLARKRNLSNNHEQIVWAVDAVQTVCEMLSDICINVLKRRLAVGDVYSLFGIELLRHGKPLRILLDTQYYNDDRSGSNHKMVKMHVQDWLIYHDGVRRRCLILIDILWAEAVRLDDLPPDDVKTAAEAKIISGNICRKRLYQECMRVGGVGKWANAFIFPFFLRHAEYRRGKFWRGIDKGRIEARDKEWTKRLLRNNWQ